VTAGSKDRGSGNAGDEDDPGDTDSFASLLGDAKPLARGPVRLPPTSGRPHARHRSGPNDGTRVTGKFRWPDSNDRHRAVADGVTDSQLAALSRGDPEPLERIDLHGTRHEQAARLVAKRLQSARAQGLDCVIVIHGRGQRSASGEAVLRDALPGWLTTGECARHVLAFAPAPKGLGGLGATLVLLRHG